MRAAFILHAGVLGYCLLSAYTAQMLNVTDSIISRPRSGRLK